MASKSPGIYYKEIDNTEYTNPAAEISTTVAIIGFAKKGPIGIPTEITNYKDFKSIFGTPISGTYAGLALRSVLSAGGSVLFVRVADETLASQSNVILKNGSAAKNGALVINCKTAIPAGSIINDKTFTNGNVYVGKIINTVTQAEKKVFLRSPAEGKFATSDILEQLNSQLTDTKAFSEFSFTTPTASGYKVLGIKKNDSETVGPYYINVSEKASGEVLATTIAETIGNGTNPYQVLEIKLSDYGVTSVENSLSTAYIRNVSGSSKFKFYVNKGGIKTLVNFKLSPDNNSEISLNDVAKQITTALTNLGTGLVCRYVIGENKAAFVFFSTTYESFDILPYADTDGFIEENFFAPIYNEGDTIPEDYSAYIELGEETNLVVGEDKTAGTASSIFALTHALIAMTPAAAVASNKETQGSITFNSKSNSLIFEQASFVANSTVTVENFSFNGMRDEFIFNNGTTEDSVSTIDGTFIAKQNETAIGSLARNIASEAGITGIVVEKNSAGQITISVKNSIEPPSIEAVTGEEFSLFNIFGSLVTEDEFANNGYTSGSDFCIVQVNGAAKVADSTQDMLIFTAREYGSGTDTIGFEISTSTSPLDGSITKNLYVYVDGIKKESFEDISYDPEAKNYFVSLINEEPENGGSEYLTVTVKRGLGKVGEVTVPNTATLTDSGVVYLGTAISDASVSFDNSNASNVTDYAAYDYKIGNNGKPSADGVVDLFLAAMDTETSGLSNKDLYSWHILITPDDGQNEEIQNAAIALCEFMEEAIYIADPPSGLSRDKVISWHNGAYLRSTPLQSTYCCTYWPWVKVYNAIESKYQYVMPSIVMAAQFCKVDNNYEPWYAPAGEVNGYCSTALDLEVNTVDKRYPNKVDRDKLYLDQNRVNPFLKLKNGNILAYGEKTCQRKNSTLTKIHTRRMLIALKKDLASVIKGFIFQPTVSENISKISGNVTTVLERYKTGGGVASYNVDTSMNTTETLQQDVLYIAIACVPVGCIEEVNITFTLNKAE